MATPEQLCCCGISELAEIRDGDAEDSLRIVDPHQQAFILFSEVQEQHHESRNRGKKLAALIRKLKLGTVTSLPVSVNPNTDHKIKPYLWRVNKSRLAAWQRKMNKIDPTGDWRYDHGDDPYYNPWA